MSTLRYFLGATLFCSLLISPAPPAQAANTLVGHWVGFVVGTRYTADLVIDNRGRYTELTKAGTLMTQRMGKWLILPNGLLRFTVTDWQPKQQCLPPSGCFPIRMPPGSAYQYRFTSSNAVLFTDVTFGKAAGTISYRRAP